MEDITSYGEITSAHHKGEMTVLGFIGGCCLALAALFFTISGLYHIGVSLYPYWERVTLGALAETKGTTNFAYFSVVASGRLLFGLFLGYLAMQMWDGRAGTRRLLLLIALPVVFLFGSYLSGLSDSVSSEFFSISILSTSLAAAGFLASLVLISMAFILSIILGERLRDSSTDTSWLKAGVYCLVLGVGFFMTFNELDVDEQNTALLNNLPPFSLPGSEIPMIVLDSVSLEYVECMEVIRQLNAASEKQDKIKETNYGNFDSFPRSARLIEIIDGNGLLQVTPVCQESGKYLVDLNGKWSCSVHGVFNKERLERGKRLQALLAGQEAEGNQNVSDQYNDYDGDE